MQRVASSRGLCFLVTLVLAINVQIVESDEPKPVDPQEVFEFWEENEGYRRREAQGPPCWQEKDDDKDDVVADVENRFLNAIVENDFWPYDPAFPPPLPGVVRPIEKAVGRLYFQTEAGTLHACTGTVIKDTAGDRSLILTAAHCLCDLKTDKWHKMFMFIPLYVLAPRGFPPGGPGPPMPRTCAEEFYGCWVPTIPLIEYRYVKQNTPYDMVPYDYGILVVPNIPPNHKRGVYPLGGPPPPANFILDANDGGVSDPFDFDNAAGPDPNNGDDGVWLGYPVVDDPELKYCAQDIKLDERTVKVHGVETKEPIWEFPNCALTGGASGGPALKNSGTPMNPVVNDNPIFSVLSTTKASTGKTAHGPVLYNYFTQCVWPAANNIPLGSAPAVVKGEKCEIIKKADVKDDPHFKTWTGKMYDFMGACDLVLLRAPNFGRNVTLDIVIRTKIRYSYSYVETAVVKIGDDILEVSSYGAYSLNSVSDAEMPNLVAGFIVTHMDPSDKVHLFEIHLGLEESIIIRTFKDMVSVKLDNADSERFRNSVGMLGDFDTGVLLARDGVTVMDVEDPNALAAEWQVHDDEPMLFEVPQYPQYPEKCVLPEPHTKEKRRRLGESISREAAEEACANWSDGTKEGCIFDVMATGDLDLAEAGAF